MKLSVVWQPLTDANQLLPNLIHHYWSLWRNGHQHFWQTLSPIQPINTKLETAVGLTVDFLWHSLSFSCRSCKNSKKSNCHTVYTDRLFQNFHWRVLRDTSQIIKCIFFSTTYYQPILWFSKGPIIGEMGPYFITYSVYRQVEQHLFLNTK